MIQIKGFSLIEVLISLLILSLLLLGMDMIELISLKENRNAYFFSVASNQLYSMAERLRVHAKHNLQNQIELWNQQNQALLPQGIGKVTGHFPLYTITIFWGDKNHDFHCVNSGKLKCISEQIYVG